MLKVHFIGCGKLGKTIAKLLVLNQIAKISGVINRTQKSAEKAVDFIGQGHAYASVNDLPQADIIFITANDSHIEPICASLAQTASIQSKPLVVHASGALSSDILNSARDKGCPVASMHFIKSFANPTVAIQTFKNTYCALQGDEQALDILTPLLQEMGASLFNLDKQHKFLYHAALVMGNNYIVALSNLAVNNLIAAGVPENIALKLMTNMINEASTNIANSNHQAALTGPIQRGDIATVAAHLTTLNHDTLTKNVYISLARASLLLTDHDEKTHQALETLLNQEATK